MQTIRVIPDPFWQGERASESRFVTALKSAGADAMHAGSCYSRVLTEDGARIDVAEDSDLRALADALPGYTIVQLPGTGA